MFAQGAAVVKLNPKESVVTVHGEGAISNGRYPDLLIISPGDTQIASIGVLLVFRLWVAGGEAGEC